MLLMKQALYHQATTAGSQLGEFKCFLYVETSFSDKPSEVYIFIIQQLGWYIMCGEVWVGRIAWDDDGLAGPCMVGF